jgi:TDG/mug DNA glycosylase family protein
MDRRTREVYEREARTWIGARRPVALEDGRIEALAARVAAGARVADLGSGPGWYAAALCAAGRPALALDVSLEMLRAAGERTPGLPRVCADLAALPFARGSFAGAVALNAYQHLPLAELPAALAQLHDALAEGGALELTLADLERAEPDSDEQAQGGAQRRVSRNFPGRLFSYCTEAFARDLLEGAGFEVDGLERDAFWLRIRATRRFSLPDFVRPELALLVCGLNPSLYAAQYGIPFGRPGHRFWPAARAAGLIEQEFDPRAALRRGVGFTDLAKRATRRADELHPAEYRVGLERLRALLRRERPGALVFVGLDGWRKAVDRHARAGRIDGGFEDTPTYLMPSTSGLNARCSLDELIAHLRSAARA